MSIICTIIASIFLTQTTEAHGRLTNPVPRFGTGTNNGQENAPVTFGGDQWVCRHDGPVSPITEEITPGGSLSLTWDFSAAHVGDCAVYVSYDYELPRSEQKFFKIANLPKCREFTGTPVSIDIPQWLPAGQVVIRWDWYALHQHPNVEFYSQCFDAMVLGSNPQRADIYAYTINNPNVYPATANEGVGYRNAFNGNEEQYMTGPPCALGFDGNDCAMSTCGTTGFVDVKDLNGDGPYSCTEFDGNLLDGEGQNEENGQENQATEESTSGCDAENDTIASKNKVIAGLSVTLAFVLIAFGVYVAWTQGWISMDEKAPQVNVQEKASVPTVPQHVSVPVSGTSGSDSSAPQWHYQNTNGETVGPVSQTSLVSWACTLGKERAGEMYVWNESMSEWRFMKHVPVLMAQLSTSKRL